MKLEFIKLVEDENGSKKPAHKWADGGLSHKEVDGWPNIGMIVPEGFIILDFDTKSDSEIMLKIIDALKIKTKVVKTTRGIHCYFRESEKSKQLKSVPKKRTAISIYVDYRTAKKSYVKIKDNGVMRKIIRNTPDNDMEEMPDWLLPVADNTGNFSFKDMGEGDGRNAKLFSYITLLRSKGFEKEDIVSILEIINHFVFAESLDGDEMRTIYRDEAFELPIDNRVEIKNQYTIDEMKFLLDVCVYQTLYYEDEKLEKLNSLIERLRKDIGEDEHS